jgi:hypothetical protein
MGNLTDNFSRSEFLCKCGCGLADPHPALVMGLQDLCDKGRSVMSMKPVFVVTSGCRCPAHNRVVGGAEKSRHLPQEHGYCEAVDGFLVGWTLRDMYRLAEQVPRFAGGGIGVYLDAGGPRLHLDVRRIGIPARWARLYGEVVSLEDCFHRDEANRKDLT